MSTKNELLARAKELNLVGRHEMTKTELEAKLNEIAAAHTEVARARRTKKIANVKRNKPYLFKYYRVDAERAAAALANEKVAKQAKLMVQAMIDAGYTTSESAVIGETIAATAKAYGMKTTIGNRELSAYYLPLMVAKLGVEFDRYAG